MPEKGTMQQHPTRYNLHSRLLHKNFPALGVAEIQADRATCEFNQSQTRDNG